MLVIRMQRTGRKGHAMFRVVVQDSRQTPTSGKLVAHLGNYDPHSKTVSLNKEKAAFYLEHGAQPSDRAVRLLKSEGVKLPKWVQEPAKKERAVRNPEKRRSTAPEKPVEEPAKPSDDKPADYAASDTVASDNTDDAVSDADNAEDTANTEESTTEKPAEEPAKDKDSADKPEDTGEAKS